VTQAPTVVALVPARAGSRRVPGKNVRRLGGHPLLAYSIAAAREAGVFQRVVLSTDDAEYAAIGRHYGADVPFLRPAELAGPAATDIGWIQHALAELRSAGEQVEAFVILRPTSPFRTATTIRRAWELFTAATAVDSLRAVEPAAQHPGKMWRILGGRLVPVLPVQPDGVPWHSRPTQSLPPVWVQNASLEIAWTRCADAGSIAGEAVLPFLTEGYEGFDINSEYDWSYAEHELASGRAALPVVSTSPWPTERPSKSSQHEEMSTHG
jgi:CMP-N,N'-diacetyllegionaminic acid synthase